MGCNCLCQINHPKERGICTGKFDRMVIFKGQTVGQRDVQMCDHCADATLAHKRLKDR